MLVQLRFFVIAVTMLMPLMVSAQTTPIPLLSQWEQMMVQYGNQHCQMLQGSWASGDEKLAGTYYDAERVYYQIADYTNDSKWLDCARAAEQVYRDGYLLGNNGGLPGFWVFPHGLWKDYKRTGDTASKNALLLVSQNAAFAYDGTPLGALSDPILSREVAYNLQSKILAKDLGASTDASMNRLAEEAFRHMNAWFVTKTAEFIQPFMVGLTSEALINYYKKTGDARVLPAIRVAMDYLWNNLWVSSAMAFLYIDRAIASEGGQGAVQPASDLNLLIAPAFAWLYDQTGETKWLDRGDQIFTGGVMQAFLENAKQFNQSYRWSFDYVVWRKKVGTTFITFDSTPAPPPVTPPTSTSGSVSTTPSTDPSANDSSLEPPPGHYRFKRR
jgi:hypothetical protein